VEDDPLYEKAKHHALQYLSYRGRSIQEVRTKLEGKGFSDTVIKKVVDRCIDLGYLSDKNFARQWAQNLAITRLWGDRKIERNLIEKGISRDLIKDAIAEIREEKDERRAIEELVEKRLRRESACEVFSYKGKRRLAQSIAGRGFPVGLILDVLNRMGEGDCDNHRP
jgi:regulatory protein